MNELKENNIEIKEKENESLPVNDNTQNPENKSVTVALLNEILAAVKQNGENAKKNAAEIFARIQAVEEKNALLADQIEKLRDQTFAVHLVEVTENDVTKPESYHNLILDQTVELKNSIDDLKTLVKTESFAQQAPKHDSLASVLEEIKSDIDDVKAKLELNELNDAEPDADKTDESREQLSLSIDELKKELTKIAEDFNLD